MISACSYETPVGALTVLATGIDEATGDDSAVATIVAAGFCPAADLWDRLPTDDGSELQTVDHLGALHEPIERYLDGDLEALDQVAVAQKGTDLQQQVWEGLRQIPAGETRTYSELAETTSKPKAVRAVGSACGRNLIAPFVPCHRALRSDGTLGGYYYGLDVKRWLLAHESQSDQLSLELQ
ncbi:MAG: methylated-DNA--[protein]-cysteine S-methyltransferase [Acidimicrobiales bacterium]